MPRDLRNGLNSKIKMNNNFASITDTSNLAKGDKIYFLEEPNRPYTVVGSKDNFVIAIRYLNRKQSLFLYTILDIKELERGSNNLVFNIYDYEKEDEVNACLDQLISGECEISHRNKIDLSIIKIIKSK